MKFVFICQKFGLDHVNSFDEQDVAKVTQAKAFKAIVHWGLPSLSVDNLGPMLWWKMRDLWKNHWPKQPNHSSCCHCPADPPADCSPMNKPRWEKKTVWPPKESSEITNYSHFKSLNLGVILYSKTIWYNYFDNSMYHQLGFI